MQDVAYLDSPSALGQIGLELGLVFGSEWPYGTCRRAGGFVDRLRLCFNILRGSQLRQQGSVVPGPLSAAWTDR